MNVIELKNVSVSYKSMQENIEAVKGVSFEVKSGSYFCIVGKNGSGKSSLINAIVGIVSNISGTIDIRVDKKDISYLSQANVIPKDFPATVEEVVLCGTQKRGKAFFRYSKDNKAEAEYGMDLLGVIDLKDRRFGTLSGGQQQRVLLARAICINPKILILDEPFFGLDEDIQLSLYEALEGLHKQLGTTVVMVSHDIEYVKKYATDVAQMDNGQIIFVGPKLLWSQRKEVR